VVNEPIAERNEHAVHLEIDHTSGSYHQCCQEQDGTKGWRTAFRSGHDGSPEGSGHVCWALRAPWPLPHPDTGNITVCEVAAEDGKAMITVTRCARQSRTSVCRGHRAPIH